MDMSVPGIPRIGFLIRDDHLAVKAEGVLSAPLDVSKNIAKACKALVKQKFCKAHVLPDPGYRLSGGEAVILFEAHFDKQYPFETMILELTGYAALLNELSRRAGENARSIPRLPLERIIPSDSARELLLAFAHLKAYGCTIWAPTRNGDMEIVPPSLEDLATPAEAQAVTLQSAPVTGCLTHREGGCTIVLNDEYSLKFPKAARQWGIDLLAQHLFFSGTIIKSGTGCSLDETKLFSFEASKAEAGAEGWVEGPEPFDPQFPGGKPTFVAMHKAKAKPRE